MRAQFIKTVIDDKPADVPISIKDGFQVAGVPTTLGLLALINNVSDSNAAIVDLLLDLGAVIYVKTNVPQTLMVRHGIFSTAYWSR